MLHEKRALLALTALFVGACTAGAPDAPTATTPSHDTPAPAQAAGVAVLPPRQDVPSMPDDLHTPSATTPPAPDSVLYFIFQKDGDGALSYEVENGSWAHYWYGYPFELGGKQYFTGFAYQTPAKYGNSDEAQYPDPDAKVTLAQATYVLAPGDAAKPWVFEGAERHVGEFGGYEKGNAVDDTRKPRSYTTPGGKRLLAVPTWSLESGTRLASFDVLVFNPGEPQQVDDTHWTYLGNIVVGEDNGAACDDDAGRLPCAKSTGTLDFIADDGNDLPLIRIAMHGTTIGDDGKLRTLDGEALDYRYDASRKQYQPQ
jgi:hypothetical protein